MVRAFLIGCAFLLVVGCAGTRSDTPKEEQGRTASTEEQTRSPEATASEEQTRCEVTRTTVRQGFHRRREGFLTNDLPSCPKGGPLSGTEGSDNLDGKEGEGEIRGYGKRDFLFGGPGNDVIYGGPGDDIWLFGGDGADVIHGGEGSDGFEEGPGANVFYGGDGDDFVWVGPKDGQTDELYCGKGKDEYAGGVEDIDHMDGCEKKAKLEVIY